MRAVLTSLTHFRSPHQTPPLLHLEHLKPHLPLAGSHLLPRPLRLALRSGRVSIRTQQHQSKWKLTTRPSLGTPRIMIQKRRRVHCLSDCCRTYAAVTCPMAASILLNELSAHRTQVLLQQRGSSSEGSTGERTSVDPSSSSESSSSFGQQWREQQ